jgi:hypothetical protein
VFLDGGEVAVAGGERGFVVGGEGVGEAVGAGEFVFGVDFSGEEAGSSEWLARGRGVDWVICGR